MTPSPWAPRQEAPQPAEQGGRAPQEQRSDGAEDTKVTARDRGCGSSSIWWEHGSLHGKQEVMQDRTQRDDRHADRSSTFRSRQVHPGGRSSRKSGLFDPYQPTGRSGSTLPSLTLSKLRLTSSRAAGVTGRLEGDVPDCPHCFKHTRRPPAQTLPRLGSAPQLPDSRCLREGSAPSKNSGPQGSSRLPGERHSHSQKQRASVRPSQREDSEACTRFLWIPLARIFFLLILFRVLCSNHL